MTTIERGCAVDGTSGQGEIRATYAQLVAAFGEPTHPEPSMDCKTDVEWQLTIDGVPVCIYNWKNGPAYLGEGEGIPVEQIDEWNIGGHSQEAKAKVMQVLGGRQ